MIPLVLVWFRAAGLAGQALAVGGAIFALVVLRASREPGPPRARERALGLAAAGALLAAAAQAGGLAVLAAAFADEGGWPVEAVLASTPGAVGLLRIAAAAAAAGAALAVRRAPGSVGAWTILLAAAGLLPVTSALVSHATGRVAGEVWLVALGALHQAAASAWAGGLVCGAALAVREETRASIAWLGRFSAVAATAVGLLAVTGIAMSLEYVATPAAAIGTSYGAMVLTKIALFSALLAMGALNYRALRGRAGAAPAALSPGAPARDLTPASTLLLRRRVEVEAGLAVVILLLAASIASAPPAADLGGEQASLAEVVHVFTPRWPRLQSPSLADLQATSGLGDPDVPRTAEETAWSEFGHNVAGLFILAMGLLAMLERTGRAPWARHWPLLIVGLTGFVAWSLDPEGWQTGLVGFWEHLLDPEVLQHRLMLGLTAAFGLAEWRVRSGRHAASRWRYVFPVVCMASGALLLSHAHEVGDARTAFLMEVSHLPMGVLVLVAGWSRWLELRLPPAAGVRSGWLWAPALALFGLILVFYREG